MQKSLTQAAQQWADKITTTWDKVTATWRDSVAGIIACGQQLIDAKKELQHGEFLPMVRQGLPFGPRGAQLLMKVARDERFRNAKYVSHLPPNLGALADMTRLDDATFEHGIAEGIITPEMERADLAPLLPAPRPQKPAKSTQFVSPPSQNFLIPRERTEQRTGQTLTITVRKGEKIWPLNPPFVAGPARPLIPDPASEDEQAQVIAAELVEAGGDLSARTIGAMEKNHRVRFYILKFTNELEQRRATG